MIPLKSKNQQSNHQETNCDVPIVCPTEKTGGKQCFSNRGFGISSMFGLVSLLAVVWMGPACNRRGSQLDSLAQQMGTAKNHQKRLIAVEQLIELASPEAYAVLLELGPTNSYPVVRAHLLNQMEQISPDFRAKLLQAYLVEDVYEFQIGAIRYAEKLLETEYPKITNMSSQEEREQVVNQCLEDLKVFQESTR